MSTGRGIPTNNNLHLLVHCGVDCTPISNFIYFDLVQDNCLHWREQLCCVQITIGSIRGYPLVLSSTIDPSVMFTTAGWQVQKELCTKIQKLNISTILESILNLASIRTLSIARRVYMICFIWIITSLSDLSFLHLAEEPELIDQTNYLADIFFRGWLSMPAQTFGR